MNRWTPRAGGSPRSRRPRPHSPRPRTPGPERDAPRARDPRIVAGAEADHRRRTRMDAVVARLQHLDVLGPVIARDRRLGCWLRAMDRASREGREPVSLHEPPREPEPLHAERMLGAVVEAPPVVRVDQRRLCHVPDFPPVFSTSSMRSIVTPFSTALIMS